MCKSSTQGPGPWCQPPLLSSASTACSTQGDGMTPLSAVGQLSPRPDPIPLFIPPGGSPASHSRPHSRAGRSHAAGARSNRDPLPPWHCGTGASTPGCPCSLGRHPGPAVSAREAPASLCGFRQPCSRKICSAEGPGMLQPRQQAVLTPSSPQGSCYQCHAFVMGCAPRQQRERCFGSGRAQSCWQPGQGGRRSWCWDAGQRGGGVPRSGSPQLTSSAAWLRHRTAL